MTGRITHVPAPRDLCAARACPGKPDPAPLRRGTIWTCDDCSREWVVVHGAQYNEPYHAWRRLTERNRDGIERR